LEAAGRQRFVVCGFFCCKEEKKKTQSSSERVRNFNHYNNKCGIGARSKNFGFVSSIVGREEGRKTGGNSLVWKLNSGISPNFGLVFVVASFLRYRELCGAAALLLVFFLFF
jgi:hypothetical protein